MSINLHAITIYWSNLFFFSLLKINLCNWDSNLFSLYKIQCMSGNNKSKILAGSVNYELKWYVVTCVLYYSSFLLKDWALLCDLTIGHRCCLCQKTKTFLRMHKRTRRSTCPSLHTICDTHWVQPMRLVGSSCFIIVFDILELTWIMGLIKRWPICRNSVRTY